ncbi:dihydrofolate reductase family protein [Kitasatospora sp. NPDC058170]|uniref:dihydrofolate reductase family protein n=1 Tax=Kitasatospora sp. NPDC058170 TaxID=3346364 RepID=UPI0036DE8896
MTAQRRIVTGLFISLDGVVEAPETWHFPYMNDEMGAAVGRMHAEADTLLLGRKTYESFAAVWPQQSGELADAINGIRKLVASTTLTDTEWNNSAVIEGDVVAALKELKQQPGGNINLTGSIGLTRTLLEAGLVDELRLLVHPIVLGTGLRLFPEGSPRVPLKLTGSVTFSTGVLDLTYQPA